MQNFKIKGSDNMFLITPELETERLILKKGTAEDFIKVYEFNFTKLRDICGEFEFVKNDPDFVATFANYSEETENVYDWVMYLKETMEPIANITADQYNNELNSLELTFNMHPSYWGNGYMKEATIEVMRFLFQNGYDNVVSGYGEGNNKSKRVHEKIGFEFYKKEENSWQKNGVPITKYVHIMSKDNFEHLYGTKTK